MENTRIYLDVVRDAAALLGTQVRAGRQERGWTIAELARRARLSRLTLMKIEHGDPSVSLGNALQVAALVGVPLFDDDERLLAAEARFARNALLRRRVRPKAMPEADLDF